MEKSIYNSLGQHEPVFIVGNGVIAKALAVALSLNGRSVSILRGSVEEPGLSWQCIWVETGNETLKADIKISSISSYDRLDGLILLANKSFGNDQIAVKLKEKALSSSIVFLQNGLHVESNFVDLGFKDLYRCVLFTTSESIGENRVKFKPVTDSPIGVINGSPERLAAIVALLNTSIFSFRAEPDIQPVIWKKAITNCVFNSICPLLEVDNGIFHRNNAALEIGKNVIRECLHVARAAGIQLTEQEVVDNVLMISRFSDGQKISTYQDILNNRETEIESLNFAIAGTAKRLGTGQVPTTSLLGELIRVKSEIFMSGKLNMKAS